jgi:hypothetical protein
LTAETALDDERRRVLDGFADSQMPRLLDAVRALALPIFRARAGAGDRLSYRQFLRKVWLMKLMNQLMATMPTPG